MYGFVGKVAGRSRGVPDGSETIAPIKGWNYAGGAWRHRDGRVYGVGGPEDPGAVLADTVAESKTRLMMAAGASVLILLAVGLVAKGGRRKPTQIWRDRR